MSLIKRAAFFTVAVPTVFALSAGTANASIITTNDQTVKAPIGDACVFVGQTTVYNPLTEPELFTTDERTGVYADCDDV